MKYLFLLILLLRLLLPAAARAETCSFTAGTLDFGAVNVLAGGAKDGVLPVDVRCPGLIGNSVWMTFHIAAGDGGGNATARTMRSGTTTLLAYQLYTDNARTRVFGSSRHSFGGETLTLSDGAILGSTVLRLNIYGRVFGNQGSIVPGAYSSNFIGQSHVWVDFWICKVLICWSETATFSFSVTATVPADCQLASGRLDFGSTGTLASPVDASAAIDVRCTANTPYAVSLGNGLDGSGPTERNMRSPAGHRLHYGLYRDAARSQPWGLEAAGAAQSATGTGSVTRFTVHGRVPAQPTPPAGSYSDTVLVTVTY